MVERKEIRDDKNNRDRAVQSDDFQAVDEVIAGVNAAIVDERADGVHLSYDRMASFLAAYGNRDALRVAEDLDNKIETLLREAAA
jgi:hypothetical protein